MNIYIAIVLLVFLTSPCFATETVECEDLQWNLVVTGAPGTYRGTVKAGSADVIHIEARKRNGKTVIGQGMSFVNTDGSWEIIIWADYNLKKSHRARFYCEKY